MIRIIPETERTEDHIHAKANATSEGRHVLVQSWTVESALDLDALGIDGVRGTSGHG